MKSYRLNAVCDAGHGSSGKGAVATRLADRYVSRVFTSTNQSNAGHTAIVGEDKFISKILPTPLVLARKYPDQQFTGYLGATAGFTIEQFMKEYNFVNINENVEIIIHPRAIICEQRHIDAEKDGAFSTKHLASTMTGSGYSAAEKMMRLPSVKLAKDYHSTLTSTSGRSERWVATRSDRFARQLRSDIATSSPGVIHEVSQGYSLSLNWGTHYPQCTSRDCTPTQGLNDLGVLPQSLGDVYMNVRSFPIRVGNVVEDGVKKGDSGGVWFDQEELTWEQIAADAEMPAGMAEQLQLNELTTVTRRLRRCFTQSWDWCRVSAEMLGANKMILNFPQYIHWSCNGLRGGPEMLDQLHPKVRAYIDKLEESAGIKLSALMTGANHEDVIWLD